MAANGLKMTCDFTRTITEYAGLPADAVFTLLEGFRKVVPLTDRERVKLFLLLDEQLVWKRIGESGAQAWRQARRLGLL
jgi:Ser/Thr protein kinase RdoA (MazF antagonist)